MKVMSFRKAQLIREYFTPEQIKFWRKKGREKKPEPEFEQLSLPWPAIEMLSKAEHESRITKKGQRNTRREK